MELVLSCVSTLHALEINLYVCVYLIYNKRYTKKKSSNMAHSIYWFNKSVHMSYFSIKWTTDVNENKHYFSAFKMETTNSLISMKICFTQLSETDRFFSPYQQQHEFRLHWRVFQNPKIWNDSMRFHITLAAKFLLVRFRNSPRSL